MPTANSFWDVSQIKVSSQSLDVAQKGTWLAQGYFSPVVKCRKNNPRLLYMCIL
jgi:hypothetical protein